VNALQGTQFAFLFLLTWGLSRWFRRVLDEDLSRRAVFGKVTAVILIGAGLFLITRS
jgi:threonine/homoserine/homoserine lactone efflux protein